jgi:hypothetical protein
MDCADDFGLSLAARPRQPGRHAARGGDARPAAGLGRRRTGPLEQKPLELAVVHWRPVASRLDRGRPKPHQEPRGAGRLTQQPITPRFASAKAIGTTRSSELRPNVTRPRQMVQPKHVAQADSFPRRPGTAQPSSHAKESSSTTLANRLRSATVNCSGGATSRRPASAQVRRATPTNALAK